MTEHLVADLRKNSRENIRIRRTEFQGYQLVDMRLFALKEDGSFVATPKGVSIRLEMVDAVIEALRQAKALAAVPEDDGARSNRANQSRRSKRRDTSSREFDPALNDPLPW